MSLVELLRRRGFDRTEVPEPGEHVRPRCTQCEVLVINGVATHETGYPNSKRRRDLEEVDDE